MNTASLKTRLKKLEPKVTGYNFFGSLHESDPKAFPNDIKQRVFGMYRVYGYFGGMCAVYASDSIDSIEYGLKKLKEELRKFTHEKTSILHVKTISENEHLLLQTVYALDGLNIRNKYPHGCNEELTTSIYTGIDFKNASYKDWVSFLNSVP